MNHYTDEQFEDILQNKDVDPAHLEQCEDCRNRLEEKRAIAARLRSAFDSVKPDAELASRIHVQLDSLDAKAHRHHKLWSALAAAAAIIVVLVPLALYLAATSSTVASRAQLAKIHHLNLAPNHEFHSSDDPEKLAEYFKDKLDFVPALPLIDKGMEIRGCCVAHFKGSIVGSYVVDTPKGIISIIVVTDTPKSIGMRKIHKSTQTDQTYWRGSFARCSMVSVRLGDYSYCAVAEISHDYLKDLLERLLPVIQE
ncbi:MAG: anti-sigma factor family protein [Planctomycetota bacterium]|jgi:hypothetical protein